MNDVAVPSADTPLWLADFCRDYPLFLFGAGKWMLVLGIVLGVALAVVTLILLLRKKDGAGDSLRAAGAASPTAILDAIKGFLQALSSAPTWLALFGGGILLIWMAGSVTPEQCQAPAPAADGSAGSGAPAEPAGAAKADR